MPQVTSGSTNNSDIDSYSSNSRSNSNSSVQDKSLRKRVVASTTTTTTTDTEYDIENYIEHLTQQRYAVKLYKEPLTMMYHFTCVVVEQCLSLFRICLRNLIIAASFMVLVLLIIIGLNIPDTNLPLFIVTMRENIVEEGLFIFWWIVLGILSSVGLGSGLHTFLLFLGPYIIRIAVNASLCDSVDFTANINWFEKGNLFNLITHPDGAFDCDTKDQNITILSIMWKVQWASFLWGLGTAIGELPPYFIARTARLKGERIKELEGLHLHAGSGTSSSSNSSSSSTSSSRMNIMLRVKEYVYSFVQKGGFIAIMLFASIPNPLFDLAGLTCGHFLVPFWTFFIATAIGKAVIKTQLQSIVYVAVFNEKSFDSLWMFVHNNTPSLIWVMDKLSSALGSVAGTSCRESEDCSTCCFDMLDRDHQQEAKISCISGCGGSSEDGSGSGGSWVTYLWKKFLICMISYFIYTFMDSIVQDRLQRLDEEKIKNFIDKNNMDNNNNNLTSISTTTTASSNKNSVNEIESDSIAMRTRTRSRNGSPAKKLNSTTSSSTTTYDLRLSPMRKEK